MKIMKRIASCCLAVLLVISLVQSFAINVRAATTMTESTFNTKLNKFKSDVYSNGSTYQDNSASTLGYQCFGYANYIAKYIYGSFPTSRNTGLTVNAGWELTRGASAIDNLHIGDIVRYRYANSYYINHSIFITGIDGETVYYTDANSDGSNTVKWGNKTTKADLKANVAKYLNDQNGSLTSQKGFVAHYTNWTPILSIKYNANGGTIPNTDITGYTYKVTESAGVNMRKGAGTSCDVVTTLTKDTTFSVNVGDTKTANGYTWGKTTVSGNTGWVVISDFVSKIATLRDTDYYLSSSLVYKTSSSSVLVHKMTYGETSTSGLYNASTFGLTREGYVFAGWSLSTEDGTVIDQDQALKPEEIVPELKEGSKTVTLYAIWEENTPANLIFNYDPNGGTGSMDSVVVAKGETMALSENRFTKERSAFAGWTLQREDGLWYTDSNTWCTEEEISAQAYSKMVFADGASISLTAPLVTQSGDHSYTLNALWRKEGIERIAITSIGKENIYYVGDDLNTSDISLMVQYQDGWCETVTEGFTCEPMTLSEEGTQEITLTYDSFTATYNVQVTSVKTGKNNATAKTDSKGYLLPSTSAATIAGQGAWKDDSLQVLCKDGDFYLAFIPWGATSVTDTNRVLLYLPAASVTVSGSVPDAESYYSMNPTGENNATVTMQVNAYHRTDGGNTPVKYNNVAYTAMGPVEAGARVRVLFKMDNYYCIQTSAFTGFVETGVITLDSELCGIYIDASTTDFHLEAVKGGEVDDSGLCVAGVYSDGACLTMEEYEISLPDTSDTGIKYATVSCCGFETYVPVEIRELSVDEICNEIKLSNAAPTLYDNIAMNYKADKTRFDELGITNPYLVVSFNGEETTLTDYTVSEDGTQYVFTFYNIAPNQMDDTLTATLYATYGGSVYEGATLEYSVATYCYRMLSNSAVVNSDAYAELRTLLVDLLHYGAAAQSFTGYEGELVNARLTETQKAWGTTSDPTLEDKTATKYATVENPTAAWKSVGLVLEDAVTMRFKFTAPSTDGLSLKITSDTNTSGWVIDASNFLYEESTGRYYVDFGGLHAGQMRECVYVTVYSGDTAISNTLRYTVESYANKYQSADAATYPNLAELVKAMMRYGDAAYNFAN